MTYATEKTRNGRQPVLIVELTLDFCTRTYGSAPCTAAVGVTGPTKCFNTRKTCQDSANFNRGTKVYRFSNVILPASPDPQFQTIPCLDTVSLLPTKIEPGKGIGKRSVMTVTLNDFAHSDLGIDPYLADRAYNSATLGTFFTKLLARNPYYQGRELRVRSGFIDGNNPPDAANFRDSYHKMERIEGPDKAGRVRITAKDPLKALDDARALAPRPSTGVLAVAMDAAVGTLTLSPAGIGNAEYPASGKVVVDEEVMDFISRSGDVLTLTRGVNFTTAAEHDINVPVQLCLSYSSAFLTDILHELLTDYGAIDPALIDLAAWNAEASTWLSEYSLTAVVTEPTPVGKLVAELAEQCQFFVWWDEFSQTIPFKAVRPWAFDEVAELTDEYHILADSQSVRDRPEDRISQVLLYFGQKDPTEDLDKPWNYQRLKVDTDADSETAEQYGDSRIKITFSRWFSASQVSPATKFTSRTLARYRSNPRTITLAIDAKDSELKTGDVVLATMRTLTDYTGARLPSYLQIIEVKEVVAGTKFDLTLEDTGFSGRYGLWATPGLPDFTLADGATQARYGFWSDADALMGDSSEGYRWA